MSDFDPDAFLAAPAPKEEGAFDPDTFLAEKPPEVRSFLDKTKDVASNVVSKVGQSFSNLGHTVASAARGAADLASPVSSEGGLQVPFGKLADPAYRHELERGVSDTVTGGLAEKAANSVSPSFAATRESDAAAAPNARALGQVVGTALPSPFNYLGGQAAKLVPGAGPLAAAAKGIAGYEASAVPQAVVSAPSGHRAEAALDAATDPAGLVTSATIPAVTSFLAKKLDVAAERAPEVQDAARKRAVKDLGKDITSAEGVSSSHTDKKRIAEVNDRLYDLADKNPELRQAFAEPAEAALPKIQVFKEKIAAPLDRLYDAIDEKTGGLDPQQVVNDFRAQAKEAGKSVAGLDDADRLNKLADRFEKVYITDREAPAPATQQHGAGSPPLNENFWKEVERATQQHGAGSPPLNENFWTTNPGAKGKSEPDVSGALAQLRKLRENAKGVAAKAIDEQIGKLEEEGAPKTEVSPASAMSLDKIPTRVFRQEVTDLLKRSDSIMGAIEGTPRHEALQRLYEAGKSIIDKHIDNSGLPAEQVAQIRDINNGYFLVSRAEQAIESRGWKEANKPGYKFPTTVRQAVHGGGLGGIAAAAAIGGPHAVVHALPYVAGTALATHALPKIMKSVNWDMAHGGYARAIGNLAKVARTTADVGQFVSQATRAGLAQAQARKIWEAAHAAPSVTSQPGDITL